MVQENGSLVLGAISVEANVPLGAPGESPVEHHGLIILAIPQPLPQRAFTLFRELDPALIRECT